MADKDRFGRSEREYTDMADRRMYGKYASPSAIRRSQQNRQLQNLAGVRLDDWGDPHVIGSNYHLWDTVDDPMDRLIYNEETSSAFGFPQSLSRGIPAAGLQKYYGLMGDPEEKEKQQMIRQGLSFGIDSSDYPLTKSDVASLARLAGQEGSGMYGTDPVADYYGQPTKGTMTRSNPLVQELTGTGDIPLYDIRTPENVSSGYWNNYNRRNLDPFQGSLTKSQRADVATGGKSKWNDMADQVVPSMQVAAENMRKEKRADIGPVGRRPLTSGEIGENYWNAFPQGQVWDFSEGQDMFGPMNEEYEDFPSWWNQPSAEAVERDALFNRIKKDLERHRTPFRLGLDIPHPGRLYSRGGIASLKYAR